MKSIMRKIREPFNGFSHLVGLLLSAVGLVFLIYSGLAQGTARHLVSFLIFGISLILLYAASTVYHMWPQAWRGIKLLRRIDHIMIYILIAGSYTPFCLVALRGAWGYSLLSFIWGAAVSGVIISFCRIKLSRWLSTAIYLGMGWAVVVAIIPLVRALPPAGMLWLVAGGLFYSIGAIFYGTKWPKLCPGVFSFHELWHLFVMAGSISHYWTVLRYVSAI